MNTSQVCSNEDCDRPVKVKVRGLCGKHYQRWLKTADPGEMYPHITLQEAADRRGVEFQADGCIFWMGAVAHGYGVFEHGHRGGIKAHRYSYEFLVGPIPKGMDIDHICGNRRCVNPEHLRVTTRKENAENRKGANRNTTTGVRGVHYSVAHKKFIAIVGHNGKRIRVGSFDSLVEAEIAVTAKRLELFTHNTHERDEEITHGHWWGIAT